MGPPLASRCVTGLERECVCSWRRILTTSRGAMTKLGDSCKSGRSKPRCLSAHEGSAPRYQPGRSSSSYDLETGALILEGSRHPPSSGERSRLRYQEWRRLWREQLRGSGLVCQDLPPIDVAEARSKLAQKSKSTTLVDRYIFSTGVQSMWR